MAYRASRKGLGDGCPSWAPRAACNLLLMGAGAGLALSNDVTEVAGPSAPVPFDPANPLTVGWDFGTQPIQTVTAAGTANVAALTQAVAEGAMEGSLASTSGVPNWIWLAGAGLVLWFVILPLVARR